MLIDQNAHIIMLSSELESFAHLAPIYVSMWQYLLYVLNDLFSKNSQYDSKALYEYCSEVLEKTFLHVIEQEDCPFLIPKHLRGFVYEQMGNWAQSAITAYLSKKGINYQISNGKIVPVDFQNTGTLQTNTNWSNGLHQFLQIKHGLKLTLESPETSFISNVSFFKKYHKIYGMTGTMGKEAEKQLLLDTYDVDFVTIPTNIEKDFTPAANMMVISDDWLITLSNLAIEQALNGRAVLIIAQTIDDVESIEDILKIIYSSGKIKKYSRDDTDEKDIIKEIVESGDIIIATNLAGRGTDITTSDEVESHGGLHVIVSYLPINERVELQAYGRTSRQGNTGSAQLILDADATISYLESIYPDYKGERDLAGLMSWRDLAEDTRLENDRINILPMSLLKDQLFAAYSNFVHDIINDKDLFSKEDKKLPDHWRKYFLRKQIEELWGIWLKSHQDSISLQFSDQSGDSNKELHLSNNKLFAQKLKGLFELFKTDIIKKIKENTLIDNTNLLIKKAIESSRGNFFTGEFGFSLSPNNYQDSIDMLDKAIFLDKAYSFAAYLAKARLLITKDGANKQEAVNNLEYAKIHIQETIIEQLASMLHILGLINPDNYHSDLAKQIKTKIHMFNKHIDYIEKAIETILSSSGEQFLNIKASSPLRNSLNKCQMDEIIDVDKPDDEKDYKKVNCYEGDLDFYNDELQALSDLNMDQVFEVGTYVLEEDDDGFFDAIFIAVIGVLEIIAGAAITAMSGGFASVIGAALISDGIGDILSTVVALVRGQTISLEGYFKNKGASLAMSVVASTLSYYYNSIKDSVMGVQKATEAAKITTKEATKLTVKDILVKEVPKAAKWQAVATAASVGLQIVGENVVRSQKKDIMKAVLKLLDEMFSYHIPALNKIVGYDLWKLNNYNQDRLMKLSWQILRHYSSRFHGAEVDFAKGVAIKMGNPTLTLITQGVSMVQGAVKASEAPEEFCDELAGEIESVASGLETKSMIEQALYSSFSQSDTSKIITILTQNSYINGKSFTYENCHNIRSLDYLDLEKDDEKIEDACNKVSKTLTTHYPNNINNIKQTLTAMVTGSVIQTINGEIVSTLSSIVTSKGLEYYQEHYQNKEIEEILAKEIKESANDNSKKNQKNPKAKSPPKDQEPSVNKQDDKQTSHKIEKEETIWKIAKKSGRTEEQWPDANQGSRENPGHTANNQDQQNKPNDPSDPYGHNKQLNEVRERYHNYNKEIEAKHGKDPNWFPTKHINKIWVFSKESLNTFLITEKQVLAKYCPEIYDYVSKNGDQALNYIGEKITQGDAYLENKFGSSYTKLNEFRKNYLADLKKNTPIIVYDALGMIFGSASGEVIGKTMGLGAKTYKKATASNLPKLKTPVETVKQPPVKMSADIKSQDIPHHKTPVVVESKVKSTIQPKVPTLPDAPLQQKSYQPQVSNKPYFDPARQYQMPKTGTKIDSWDKPNYPFTSNPPHLTGSNLNVRFAGEASIIPTLTKGGLTEVKLGTSAVLEKNIALGAAIQREIDAIEIPSGKKNNPHTSPDTPHSDEGVGTGNKKVEVKADDAKTSGQVGNGNYPPLQCILKINPVDNNFHLDTPSVKIVDGKINDLNIASQEMHQARKHFDKHGKDMGYGSKIDYDQAGKDFAKRFNENGFEVYHANWKKGIGPLEDQIIITDRIKSVIIDADTGQVKNFYKGTEWRGLVKIKELKR